MTRTAGIAPSAEVTGSSRCGELPAGVGRLPRIGWWENDDTSSARAAATGQLAGSTGHGVAWPASRPDVAAAAVAVLTPVDVVPASAEPVPGIPAR